MHEILYREAALIGIFVIAFLLGAESDKARSAIVPAAAKDASPPDFLVVLIDNCSDKIDSAKSSSPSRAASNFMQVHHAIPFVAIHATTPNPLHNRPHLAADAFLLLGFRFTGGRG
jgi:hypothetical protein